MHRDELRAGLKDLGTVFGDWWKLSPALLILVFPLGFRLTCYYYRKAYYRSFWLSPPACAVAEPHKSYSGETRFPLVLQNAHRWFFYAGLVFNVILTWDALLGFRNPPGEWGHMGLGTLVLLVNAALLWLYSMSCHSCRHAIGGRLDPLLQATRALQGVDLRVATEHPARACSPGSRCSASPSPTSTSTRWPRGVITDPVLLTASDLRHRRHHDRDRAVRLRRRGDRRRGAGLRAAIEARAQGKRTAIICKSLFGKAHTVMAEGGIAASMGNVNSADNWQVHFRDTMRGGKFLNHWRMAELHAKEAPDRVWELETWGALFDRTKDGRISQRNFGGHDYPRLAHVGDRTGLELIRTLQQKIVSLQQEDERELGDRRRA